MDRGQLLIDLMKTYGKLGVEKWRTVERDQRREHKLRLNWEIADDPHEVEATVESYVTNSDVNRQQLRFIPMPNNTDGIKFAFFLPLREYISGAAERFSFDLFLIIDQINSLGFRWEPSHDAPSKHGYGHIQMCRKFVRRNTQPTGIPPWIPDSFPAIPISTSDPLRMFLSLTTSVHGYEPDMLKLLKDLYPEGSLAQFYIDELTHCLHVDIS